MNFLIFMDFSRIFLNFPEFILDLFGFFKIKKSSFYRVLTWQVMWRQSDVLPCGNVYTWRVDVRACVEYMARTHAHKCVPVCMCMRVCVCAQSVISGLCNH